MILPVVAQGPVLTQEPVVFPLTTSCIRMTLELMTTAPVHDPAGLLVR